MRPEPKRTERPSWDGHKQSVRCTLTKPLPTGRTELALTALELLDRLAALIPSPRRHRHHYFGVFAPHAALRDREADPVDAVQESRPELEPPRPLAARSAPDG